MGLFGKSKKPAKSKAPGEFTDQHLATGTQAQALGNDSANPVYKVNYDAKHAMSGKETEGYFKPDADMAPASSAVGASRLAEKLGLGGLIPETTFATHQVTDATGTTSTTSGAVSKGVKGDALTDNVFDTAVPNYTGGPSDTIKVRSDGSAHKFTGSAVNDIDLSRSNTQQQMNQLQWFDALIGNEDRHGGNIIVDPTSGNVSGIDNDLSFGGSNITSGRDWYATGRDEKYLGMPENIDKDLAKKLLKLKPKDLEKILDPKGGTGTPLSKQEIKDTEKRLAAIQDRIKDYKKSGKIVKKWDANTYNAAINEDVSSRTYGTNSTQKYGNYLQRQHGYVQEAADPTTNDLWIKGQRATTAPGSLPAPPAQQLAQPPTAQAPQQVPPPVPSTVGRPALSASGGTTDASTTDASTTDRPPVRRLSSVVRNTPWADQMMKRKQPA